MAWRERTPAEYIKLLDQAVAWCTELEMYVILDWHTIGNLETGVFQDPMYDTSKQETYNFWRIMARHFAGHNTVAFYELFNEPTTYRNQLGPVSWDAWKKSVEDTIDTLWTGRLPTDTGIDDAIRLAVSVQKQLAVEAVILPTPAPTLALLSPAMDERVMILMVPPLAPPPYITAPDWAVMRRSW